MTHLTLALYLLALLAGTASLSQTFMIWQRYRKAVIRRYCFSLLGLAFAPHLHAIVLEGGFDRQGRFGHMPRLDLAKLSE